MPYSAFVVHNIAVVDHQIAAMHRIGRSADLKDSVSVQDVNQLHQIMVGVQTARMLLILFVAVVGIHQLRRAHQHM